PELVSALRSQDSEVRGSAASILDMLNWAQQDADDQAYYFVAKGDWSAAATLGNSSLNPLTLALESTTDADSVPVLLALARIAPEIAITKLAEKAYSSD